MEEVVAWAASNGDRDDDDASYQYAKRGLRLIDSRFGRNQSGSTPRKSLTPEAPGAGQRQQTYFGAPVLFAHAAGAEREVSAVGIDEVDLDSGSHRLEVNSAAR